jgi:hypothetical protein
MTRYTPNWLQQGSYLAAQDRRLLAALWPGAASNGCAVSVASGMTVNIAPGTVAVPTQNNTGTSVCVSDATEQVTLTAAPGSGTNRYDLIICRPRGNDLDGGSNNDFIFDYVTGTPAASPTTPPVPAGTVCLAYIYIPGASASIAAGNITDIRPGALAAGPTQFISAMPAASPGTIAPSGGATYTIGNLTLPAPAMVRMMVQAQIAAGATTYNAADLYCWVDGVQVPVGGHAAMQTNYGTGATGSQSQNPTAVGSVHLAAGTHTFAIRIQVGGGTGTLTISNLYGEAQVVGT